MTNDGKAELNIQSKLSNTVKNYIAYNRDWWLHGSFRQLAIYDYHFKK